MAAESSSYVTELAHQRRMVLLLAGFMLLFSAGVRFDRAFLMEDAQPQSPSSAFASLVPPPTVFLGEGAGARGAPRVRRPINGPARPDASGATAGELFPAATNITASSPAEAAVGPAVPAALQVASAAPNGQFGNAGRSLFGIPSGVIFGNNSGGGGSNPITPTTPGAVPEPETWMLMIMGIGMIGVMLRARRSAFGRAKRSIETAAA